MTETGALEYSPSDESVPPVSKPPRVWPGVILALCQWAAIEVPAYFAPQSKFHFIGMMWGPVIGVAAVLLWWLVLSRLSWRARWTGVIGFLVLAAAAFFLKHKTMNVAFYEVGLPSATSALVLAAVIDRWVGGVKLASVAGPLIVWSLICLLRSDGTSGSIRSGLYWRWTQTADERYLAAVERDPSLAGRNKDSARAKLLISVPSTTLSQGDWPAFRGKDRDGKLAGVSIRTDWAARPPALVWKHLVGLGWSSLSVVGERVFTQEQRGPKEVVACYDLLSGDQVWAHEDDVRFEESMAGPGPRATPTFADGKLYALGAKGQLNCLDPIKGTTIWTRDVATDSGASVPTWGFSSSPLVAKGLVTVITGANGKSVMAYNAKSGEIRWSSGSGFSYASMQLSRLAGVEQLLFVSAQGLTAYDPLTGAKLWNHEFALPVNANRVVQPLVLNDNDVLLGVAFDVGTRRIHVTHDGPNWASSEVWTSRKFKPYYNDMVVYRGNVYGFDANFLTCIDSETGATRWHTRGYDYGQILLLEDQGLLLVLSEKGEAALVDAKPEEYHEIARIQALDGKTWNHPVISHGKLLVRNGEWIACYDVK